MQSLSLSELPEELVVPVVRAPFPLVPLLSYAAVVEDRRLVRTLEAAEEPGFVAWIPDDPQGGPFAVGVLCQVGEPFRDDAGLQRAFLHPVVRCHWSDFQRGEQHDTIRARLLPEARSVDAELEPLAVGLIAQALLAEDDELEAILGTAAKDLGGLADEVLFHLTQQTGPDDTLLGLYAELDPRERFLAVCALAEPTPVALPTHPGLDAVRTALREMTTEDPPDLGELMNGFFAQVADEDDAVPVEMLLAFARVLAGA